MMEWERNSGLFPSWALEEHTAMHYVEEDGMVYLKTVDQMQNEKKKFNFTCGALAQHVSDTILSEVARQKACESVQKRKTKGETKRNRIMKIQKNLLLVNWCWKGGLIILITLCWNMCNVVLLRKNKRHMIRNRRVSWNI